MSNEHGDLVIRPDLKQDRDFIMSLSPVLAAPAGLPWHSREAIQAFQDDYIAEMLDGGGTTLVAEVDGHLAGFVHVCEGKDAITGEACATVPLLAVSPEVQGKGAGKLLMQAAESWAKEQGYRLLHLEVFCDNQAARAFYETIGFAGDTLAMIKQVDQD